MRKLPVSPRKIVSLVKEVRRQAEGAKRLLVIGSDGDAVAAVGNSLVGGASPEAARYVMETMVLKEGSTAVPTGLNGSTGVAVMVVGSEELSSDDLKAKLTGMHKGGIPVVLVLTEAPGIEISFPAAGIGPRQVVGMAPGGMVPADVLAEAVVSAAGDQAVPLAAKLPLLREETCRQLIRKTARQNAIVGVLFILPGADMPVMTLNEAKMVLKIAAAHGESLGTERALEILSVIGSGFGLRAIARQALDLVPGPGWMIKGGVAYSGTRAIGRAAQAYFNGSLRVTPSRLAPLVDKIKAYHNRQSL